ncbi:MAG: maltodextrin glucosidase [Betaproteobacteria bacterium]|nr:maltodextrin glucosidase [Betaproteobacteria bacterium]
MFLLHPQIAPWLIRGSEAIHVVLLAERGHGLTVQLRCEPDNETRFFDMRYAGREGELHRFEADFPWDHSNEPTIYCFKVIENARQHWLAADGQHPRIPHREQMFRINRTDTPPAWVCEQIFYQIFPDRFCQGDPGLQVKTDEYLYGDGNSRIVAKAWGEPVSPTYPASEFYGGDLIGIQNRLDYLQKELGVTALYLNPIFVSGSNHKYDTEDYYNVDAHLGGNAALATLSTELHHRGMRLILDAVVNHTATNHPWFNLYGRHDALGAAQSPASPWRHWYTFDQAGHHFGWNGYQSLPVLNYAAEELQKQIYADDNAVLRHWMRPPYSIDGWRFDVMHMLGEGPRAKNNAYYARAFRQTLREENPEAYFLGEHFNEASRWLQGDQEDGAMNYYGFAHPVREWLAGMDISYTSATLSTHDFSIWLDSARGRIPYENQLAQFNLLDSHDTARFFTLVGADSNAMKLAVTLLLTYPGTPCIYYGDEIGLEGGQDPDCRRCFDWERAHWNRELLSHYQKMIALRKQRAELRHGAYRALAAAGDVFAFARFTQSGVSLVALNRGSEPHTLRLPIWQIPAQVETWHTADNEPIVAARGWISVTLPPRGDALLLGG